MIAQPEVKHTAASFINRKKKHSEVISQNMVSLDGYCKELSHLSDKNTAINSKNNINFFIGTYTRCSVIYACFATGVPEAAGECQADHQYISTTRYPTSPAQEACGGDVI